MELSKQVCSLELAKKLKELGFPQDSLFYWENQVSKDILPSYRIVDYKADYSAFTVAELGEMLTIKYYTHRRWCKSDCLWVCENIDFPRYTETADTEADARAKMLVYLAKNKLISK